MSESDIDVANDRPAKEEQPTDGESRFSPPPLQFGISTLLWIMLAVGLIFGLLRWMRAPAATSLIVMAVLALSALAVVFLVAAISKVDDG
jgi:hypothetical protein